ncbi:MAG: hypothetical protein JSU92_15050 [Deltaproteobacteria bacterium]|nr:MAG: hypothetical protein JSU92_15050 [Deltaproteobacteria bacterium]
MKKCPYCSSVFRGITRVCPYCGSELREGSKGIIIAVFLTIIIVFGAYLYLLGEDGRVKLLQRSQQGVELVGKKLKTLQPKKWITQARKKFENKNEYKVENKVKGEYKYDGRGQVEIKLFESGKLSRGMTKDEVMSVLGKPEYQKGPVGEPPIERWIYPDQVVIFESGYVIDSFYRK